MPEGSSAAVGTAGDGEAPPPRAASLFVKFGDRTRFTVELRPGETTIVSWKKLMKDANKAEGGGITSASAAAETAAIAAEVPVADAIPDLEGQPDPNEDAPAPNRFSAVIEKIERLYKGKDSSDEEDLNDIQDDDQYDTEDSFIDDADLDEYFQVDKSKTKHDGYFVNRGTLEKVIEPSEPTIQQPKKRRRKEIVKGDGNDDSGELPSKQTKAGKTGTGKLLSAEKGVLLTSEGPSVKSSKEAKFQSHQKITVVDPSLRIPHDDGCLTLAEISDNHKLKVLSGDGDKIESMQKSHSLINKFEESEIVVQQKDESVMREKIDLNLPDTKHSMQPVKHSVMHKKEGSSVRSKVNVLEKAIRELEKMVAELRPPASDAQDADSSSQSIKRRLPREIKLKLAKVARLAHASNGNVSKELLNRLMGSVGHLCQVRTLKRHLKIMVTTSESDKQEKDEEFQLIKKEVVEMVKACVPSLMTKVVEHQSGGSGDLQESAHLDKVVKGQVFIDTTLEDKICDLYDTFVHGLDEDVAPQVRKLYAELAELWPKGVMDNHGIKRAICRAKERRRALHEINKDQEKTRKKMVATNADNTVQSEPHFTAQSQHINTKAIADPNITVPTEHNRLPTSVVTTLMPNVPNPDRPKPEKVKGTHSSSHSDPRVVGNIGLGVKKKIKKRAESLGREVHLRPEKASSHRVDDRLKQNKHPSVSLQGGPQKSSSDGFRFEPLI